MITDLRTALHDPAFVVFLSISSVVVVSMIVALIYALDRRYSIRHLGKDGVELERRDDVVHERDELTDRVTYTADRIRNHRFMTVLQVWKDEFRFIFEVPDDKALELLIKDSVRIYITEHQRAVLNVTNGASDDEEFVSDIKTANDAIAWISETHRNIHDLLFESLPDRWANLFFKWISDEHSVAVMMADAIFSGQDELMKPSSKLSIFLHNRAWQISNELIKIERRPRILNGEAHGIVYKNLTVRGINH